MAQNKNQGGDKSVVPDNVCFVVRTTQFGRATYLVAIAGTNSKSLREDICNQDLKVKGTDMVQWSSIIEKSGSFGKIALGTNRGLDTILNLLVDQKKGNLRNWFINYEFESDAEIITAGHSLGGALCYVLATYLADTRNIWGGEGRMLSTYPTAGPTPGDRTWTEHAVEILDGKIYGVMNTLDAVPRAWDRIDTVEEIYKEFGLKPKLLVKTGVRTLARLPGKPNPYYKGSGWRTFDGTFEPNPPGKPRTPFINQIMYQHLTAYVIPLGYKEYADLQHELFPRPEDK